MKKRVFRSICLIALASLLLLGGCAVLLIYRQATRDDFERLRADAAYIAAGLETGGMEYLSSITGYPGRITLIDTGGAVLFDDREDPAAMDNHAARPEVADAFENGSGRTQRQSDTLGERTLYYATLLSDGSVLRLSVQANSIWAGAARFIPWLALIALLLIAAAALTARWQTGRIIRPINELDLDAPFDTEAYKELSPLLRKIAAQKQEIGEQMQRLRRQQDEFTAITRNMAEGLLVLDWDCRVLTVNDSARRTLGIEAQPEASVPLLELSRNLELEQAAKQAVKGHRVEQALELGGRLYRLVASPSAHRAGGKGAVLLLMDDTEKLQAEQTRREFSANVSHELKTPLTSISGYAEIIRDGLVEPDDVAGFAGKIYDESARLIALISDIIKLSRLDEGPGPARAEAVDLLALAVQTGEALGPPAREKGIALSVTGERTEIPGAAPILLEVLHNLVDNGIRYTPPGGRVRVSIGREGREAFIRVADTGCGIPPEHQAHVFERFYRVDKSHSKENGGTGLGLSIVKRGALYHGGRVELMSTEGGSVFTVWLPVKNGGAS